MLQHKNDDYRYLLHTPTQILMHFCNTSLMYGFLNSDSNALIQLGPSFSAPTVVAILFVSASNFFKAIRSFCSGDKLSGDPPPPAPSRESGVGGVLDFDDSPAVISSVERFAGGGSVWGSSSSTG